LLDVGTNDQIIQGISEIWVTVLYFIIIICLCKYSPNVFKCA